MGAKQSAAMDEALRLVAGGMSKREAARTAGVHWTSLHTAINRHEIKGTRPTKVIIDDPISSRGSMSEFQIELANAIIKE